MFLDIIVSLAMLAAPSPESPLSFDAYRVPVGKAFTPANPDVRRGQARRYRTLLRRAASESPDFSGYFKVVRWGCGTCCSQFAILNLKTGDVFFPDFIVACRHPHRFADAKIDVSFEFRVDSRLIVIYGAPNEVEEQLGTRYYEWTGRELRLLKFVGDRTGA